MTSPKSSITLLEGLRDQSTESIPAAGLFSQEFQQWHASVLDVLRQNFSVTDIVLQDFERLQFEWPYDVLESLYESQLKDSEAAAVLEASKDLWHTLTQQSKFLNGMRQAHEILTAAIASLRRSDP